MSNTNSVRSQIKFQRNKQIIPWLVVLLLFIVTALSFLDRQILSMSILKIKEDIVITDNDYSWITGGFIAGYAIMFTLGGIFIDKFGSKFGLALSLGIWTIASGLHSVATSVPQLIAFRFILGVGEGACFPGVIKAVIEWIPIQKRSLATGIAIGGSAIGAVIAPLLVISMLDTFGWRTLFLVSPVVSFIWIGFWVYLNNNSHSNYKEIQSVGIKTKQYKSIFLMALKNKNTWVFIAMRMFFDPIFYFLMFWIPKFMNESKNIPLDTIGKLFWIPFLVLGVSNILGGFLSDKIFIKTSSVNIARKSLMGFSALLTLSVVLIQQVDSAVAVILLLAVFFFAHGIWITNFSTVVGDVFGNKSTSTVIGLTGTFGAISAFFINRCIGYVVTNYSYDYLWIWAGLMYPIAFIILHLVIPKIEKSESV